MTAAQLVGEWYLAALGLPPALPPPRVAEALTTVHLHNVRLFGQHARVRRRSAAAATSSSSSSSSSTSADVGVYGAVNGALPGTGLPDESNLQSAEVWTGVSYALASHLLLVNLTRQAWETALGKEVTGTQCPVII